MVNRSVPCRSTDDPFAFILRFNSGPFKVDELGGVSDEGEDFPDAVVEE